MINKEGSTKTVIFFYPGHVSWARVWSKHHWVKGIQVFINQGSLSFPRSDDIEIAKVHWEWQNLKLFSWTTGPISIKLGTKHPWVKNFQVPLNEGSFRRGDEVFFKKNKGQFNSQRRDNDFFLLLVISYHGIIVPMCLLIGNVSRVRDVV